MNWTEADLKAYMARLGAPVIEKPESRVRVQPYMNKTELRYSIYLEGLKRVGEISEWRFQEWKFKLAPNTHYTPDFGVLHRRVIGGGGGVAVDLWTLYDVKGRKMKANGSEGYWAEEDAKLKIKLCPRIWPWFRWCIVFPKSNGEWEEVEFKA